MLGVMFKTISSPASNLPTVVTGGSLFSDQMFATLSKQVTLSNTPLSLFRSVHHHSLTITAVRHRLLPQSRPNSHFTIKFSQQFHSQSTTNSLINHVPLSQLSQPWPEWSELLKSICITGCFDLKDEIVQNESLSMEFVDAACSCLGFAQHRPDILGLLPKDDIQVLINNGAPLLFKNAIGIEKRMRSFLQEEESSEATMVDLMKYILSYASNPIIYPERKFNETAESSARNLLREMANLSAPAVKKDNGTLKHEQTPRNLGPNITIKSGEWSCQKCNFFNHRRNSVCLKCESERTPNGYKGTDARKGSGYVPFVPLPSDMFAKKTENMTAGNHKEPVTKNHEPKTTISANSSEKQFTKTETQIKDSAEEEKSERWFKKVAELHDVTDLTTAISDDDFPEIMPMRKGENRFVVSKKKDRSLTSTTYKRHQAMEQENNSGFVPFVPFPPDYFAKKDENSSQMSHGISNKPTNDANLVQETRNTQINRSSSRPESSENQKVRNGWEGSSLEASAVKETDPLESQQSNTTNSSQISHGISKKPTNNANLVQETRNTQINRSSSRPETSENQKARNGWKGSSLEGSAVKETDPLDMSEEAKTERWFKRVAQIKDISELTQIPDEDFPEIMPMRKGVNRFVVSKRKTPLERRLTSQQYRTDGRTVNSEPTEKEGDGS